MGKINLDLHSFRAPQPDYRTGDVLRRVRMINETNDARQTSGLITEGIITVTQGADAYGWGISDYIEFGYKYISVPTFTWGLEGTYSGNSPSDTPYTTTGGNNYGPDLPQPIQDFIDAQDYSTWQPALFIPRIVHWHMQDALYYLGCYIMVTQVNPNVTETDKIVRMHFRFEGPGLRR